WHAEEVEEIRANQLVDDIVNYEKALLELDDIIEWHKEELKSPLMSINLQEPENQIVEMEEQNQEDITQNADENETIKQTEPENQIVEMEEQNQEDIAQNADE
ncbi:MAG: hypothetical protein ACKPKO_51640, partial [Candidatus Fonsibacter sp.]